MRHQYLLPGLALAAVLAGGCAHYPAAKPADPLEPVNRVVFQFNQTADEYVLQPVTEAYVTVTPDLIERGIDNFLSNWTYPITIVNNLLQLKLHHAAQDTARFVINSTIGILGLFDVAEDLGLPERDEDFGQTLGYWGFGKGIYLVVPLLGPSTARDLVGDVADHFTNPITYVDDTIVKYTLRALSVINMRAKLLGFDQLIDNAFDPYIFVRTAYLSRLTDKVHDDAPPGSREHSGSDE